MLVYKLIKRLRGLSIFPFCKPKNRLSKNELLAKKRSFEGNCEILSTIFQPRAEYPPIYQLARKGFIYFITLRLISTSRFIASKFIGKNLRNKPGVTVVETNVSCIGLRDILTL